MDSLQLEADEATNQDTELTAEGVATPIKGDVPNSPAPAEETVKFFNQASVSFELILVFTYFSSHIRLLHQ